MYSGEGADTGIWPFFLSFRLVVGWKYRGVNRDESEKSEEFQVIIGGPPRRGSGILTAGDNNVSQRGIRPSNSIVWVEES